MKNRVLSMIGIAARAGCIASGEFAVEKAIKTQKADLVIVAEDASENTRKSYMDAAAFYGVPIEIFGSREELGEAIGKAFRAAVAVTDENLAKAVLNRLLAYKTE